MVLEAIGIREDERTVGAAGGRRSIRQTWSIRSIAHTQMTHHLAANPMGQSAHRAFTIKAEFVASQQLHHTANVVVVLMLQI
jgi:hypothetical protein